MENETEKKTRKPRTKKSDIPITETEVVPSTKTDFITNEIKKFNIADHTIAEWKLSYGSLTINGPDDKESYEIVNTARAFIKKKRIEVEKVGKEMRGEAVAFQKAVIAEEKRIIELIDPIETHLENEKKRIDEIKEAAKLAKETQEQIILQERAVKLIACGCNFTGDAYTIGDIRISVISVKSSDEFTWSALFAAVETKFRENQEIKAREDQLRLEAEAANKKILEEALAREEANKLKEQEIARREQAIADAEAKAKKDAEDLIIAQEKAAKEQAEAEIAAKEKAEQDRLAEEQRIINEKMKVRMTALFALGYSLQADVLSFSTLPRIDIHGLPLIEDWSAYLADITTTVNKRKDEIDQERQAREEQIRKDAQEKERKRLEEEAQADLIAAKEKKDAEEKEALRIAMAAPDLEKFNKYCSVLSSVPVPQFNTPSYQAFAEIIKVDVLSILKTLHSKKPQ